MSWVLVVILSRYRMWFVDMAIVAASLHNKFSVSFTIKLMSLFCGIYASVNHVIIGSDNGLAPIRHQAIIETNAGLIGPLGTNFSEILIKKTQLFIHKNGSGNIVCEMTAISSRGRVKMHLFHFKEHYKDTTLLYNACMKTVYHKSVWEVVLIDMVNLCYCYLITGLKKIRNIFCQKCLFFELAMFENSICFFFLRISREFSLLEVRKTTCIMEQKSTFIM